MPMRCGLCNGSIPKGDPLIRVDVPLLKRQLFRCKVCVGPAPPDLPPLIERSPADPTPFAHILTGANALPFDFKRAAIGEREPGEEG